MAFTKLQDDCGTDLITRLDTTFQRRQIRQNAKLFGFQFLETRDWVKWAKELLLSYAIL